MLHTCMDFSTFKIYMDNVIFIGRKLYQPTIKIVRLGLSLTIILDNDVRICSEHPIQRHFQ